MRWAIRSLCVRSDRGVQFRPVQIEPGHCVLAVRYTESRQRKTAKRTCAVPGSSVNGGLLVTVDTCRVGEELVYPVHISQFNNSRIRTK